MNEMTEIPEPVTPKYRSGPRKGKVKDWAQEQMKEIHDMEIEGLVVALKSETDGPHWARNDQEKWEIEYMWWRLRVKIEALFDDLDGG